MKIGHLDGKGRIYNENGELILQKDEKILYRDKDRIEIDVGTNWSSFFFHPHPRYDSYESKGNFYITNQRIVRIRKPNVIASGKSYMTPFGVPTAIANMWKTKEILKEGGYEYCEIFYKDCKYYKKYGKGVTLYVQIEEKIYNKKRGEYEFVENKYITIIPTFDSQPVLVSMLEQNGISLKSPWWRR